MMQKFTILAGLAALASALPTQSSWVHPLPPLQPKPTPTTCSSNRKTATFDDVSVVPAVEANPIPTPYMGLNFQGFQVTQALVLGNLPQPGIPPHSGANLAISDSGKTLTGGSPEWTTLYPGSTVTSFCPESFYYGCALNLQQGAAALPTACNIAVTGFRKGDNTAEAVQVASQEFSFNPSTTTGTAQMALGTFNEDFVDLQYVLIQYNLPGGLAAANPLLGLAVDDVKYTIKSMGS